MLILSCQKQVTEVKYYPFDRPFNKEKAEIIELETTPLNFKEITNKIGPYFDERFGNLVVEFEDGKINKRIIPYVYDSGLIKRKNILKIKTDSILIDDGYPISELKSLMKRHYLNKNKIPYYSDSPQKAYVEISIDASKNGRELKELLSKLTYTFDEIKTEIKDSIKLVIFFNNFRQIPPPPPPPKKLDIIFNED